MAKGMTIHRAQIILDHFDDPLPPFLRKECLAAAKLGREALKREETFRSRVPRSDWRLLPGETLE